MIIATAKEIRKLLPDISDATACNYRKLCRDVLNKPKPQIITIDDFKQVFGLQE